jgi:hypothetical protein
MHHGADKLNVSCEQLLTTASSLFNGEERPEVNVVP